MPSVSMLYEIPGLGKQTVLDTTGASGPVPEGDQLTWQVETETANDASAGAKFTMWLGGKAMVILHLTKTDANTLGAALNGSGGSGTVTADTGP